MFKVLFEFIQNTEDILLPDVEIDQYYNNSTGRLHIIRDGTTLRKLLTDHLVVIRCDFDMLHIRVAIEKIRERRMAEIQTKRENLQKFPNKTSEILAAFNPIIELYDLAIKEFEKYEIEFLLNDEGNKAGINIPINQVKKQSKGGRTKDPYNAKVKAKFLDMIIEAGIVENSTCRNNNEKFAHYAKVLQNDYGLVVSAGTLENNWNKPLNDDEKKQLRALFIAQNLRHLAVKIATQQ